MKPGDQFHLGIVTAEFETTMDALSAVFGHEWGPEIGEPIAVTLPSGEAVLNLRCAFSTTVPRLELVRSIPGTMWEPAPGGVHHIGFWSEDVAADSAELASNGYVLEASRTGPDGKPFFTFQRSTTGFRVELVSTAARAGLERCWATPARQATEGNRQ
ncbi:VOC family protein [Actinomadura rugatobispora]|uniref:VOC family protein n=1 Tax=Actinomadura rugatobispora TaxID=1994 RepID=A0ABW0ZSM2_9ACTN|nr:hypothetical protein GCM10010200_110970 [Actinomadura rugatobispora]